MSGIDRDPLHVAAQRLSTGLVPVAGGATDPGFTPFPTPPLNLEMRMGTMKINANGKNGIMIRFNSGGM